MTSSRTILILLAVAGRCLAEYAATGLECEDSRDPLGIDVARPRLSWRIRSDERNQHQTAWRVIVSSTSGGLSGNRGDLWDSGKVAGDETLHLPYRGKPLASSQQVFWKVRSWDGDDEASEWSEPASWTMGLLDPSEWTARWITAETRGENLLLRRDFDVGPGLRRALAHVTGIGQYELFVNGHKAGDDLLSPGWTDYDDTVLYDTRDLTGQLHEGRNALGIALGNGMAHVVRPPGRFAKFTGSYGPQRAILQLRLEFDDGHVETIASDDTWKTHAGPITFSSIYGGEDFDARLDPKGWRNPGFDDSSWKPATRFTKPTGTLRGHSHAAEPIREIEAHRPLSARHLDENRVLYEFGQNAPIIPRVGVAGPAGSVIRLTGGELVKENGHIDRASMGGAHRGSAWWQYTKATDGTEFWFPQFYYLGSRYLLVECSPAEIGGAPSTLADLEVATVHSTARPAGRFVCSDPTLNRIRELVRWAQRSNMMSILTDCPHREKLGWLEQNHLNGPALRYEWDIDRLAAKNVRDMAGAQTTDGLVPNIAPEYKVFKGTYRAAAEWGASFIMVPWQQYLFTGDDSLLREHYDAMKRYFRYLEGRTRDGILEEGLGDWYDVVKGNPGRANLTPPGITATAHFHQNAVTLAKIAGVLGRDEDARTFRSKAGEIHGNFHRAFRQTHAPSQAALAIPLAMGIVDPADRAAAAKALVDDIAKHGHFTTGAVGTRHLFRALTDAGREDLIYQTITNPDVPGYAWQLAQGCTSLAESWTASRGASQNHFFLGQIVEWFYRDLVGIAPDEAQPGFKHIVIRPHPVRGLSWAEAEYKSTRGPIKVRWDWSGGRFSLRVTTPANTTATIWMPSDDAVEGSGRVGDRNLLRIGSGTHEFRSRWSGSKLEP